MCIILHYHFLVRLVFSSVRRKSSRAFNTNTQAGWVAKFGCWVVHAALTTLKPETSTKKPPTGVRVSPSCVFKLCHFEAYDFPGLPEDGAMQAEPSGIAEDNRVCLAVPRRLKTVVAQFLDSHQDAVELMAVLSLSHHLEEVNFRYCHKIPAAAWQQLRGATWRNLKKAHFNACLAKREMVGRCSCFVYNVYCTDLYSL